MNIQDIENPATGTPALETPLDRTYCSCVKTLIEAGVKIQLQDADKFVPNAPADVGNVILFTYPPTEQFPNGVPHVALITKIAGEGWEVVEGNFVACEKTSRVVLFNDPFIRGFYKPYRQVLDAEVTMFSNEIDQTDLEPEIMANGETVSEDSAACPAFLPFDTRIEVSGKEYTCRDRMAQRFRNGNFFDLFTFDTEAALEFGRQNLTVYVL